MLVHSITQNTYKNDLSNKNNPNFGIVVKFEDNKEILGSVANTLKASDIVLERGSHWMLFAKKLITNLQEDFAKITRNSPDDEIIISKISSGKFPYKAIYKKADGHSLELKMPLSINDFVPSNIQQRSFNPRTEGEVLRESSDYFLNELSVNLAVSTKKERISA